MNTNHATKTKYNLLPFKFFFEVSVASMAAFKDLYIGPHTNESQYSDASYEGGEGFF